MNKIKNLLSLSIFMSLCFNTYAFAEEVKTKNSVEASSSTNTSTLLTLSEAIDIGIQNSYSMKLASEKINVAKYQITETSAQSLPQLNVTTSYGRQDPVSAPPPTPGLGNNPQFAAFLGTARVNTFQNRVSASQVLFAGFKVLDAIKMANVNLDMAQEGYRQARQDVVSNVSTSYYNALKAHQLVQVNKIGLKQAESQLDQAKKLEKAGVGIKLDVIRSQNRLINVQMQLSQSLNSLAKAKKALNLAMGRSIDYPFDLNLEARVPEIEMTEEQALQNALINRSELKQLVLKKQVDEIFTTIQSRGNWPTISASFTYNLNDNAVVNGNAVNNQNLNYGLNMNWPVFDGLLTLAKVQKAQNTLIQDQISIDQLQQSVILEVKQTLLDIQEAKERLIMAKDSVSLAEESFKIAQIRYENGVGISLDLLDAQTSLLQAKSNLVNTEFDLNISRIKLYKALGIDI